MLNIIFNCYFHIKQYLSTTFDSIDELKYMIPSTRNMDVDMDMEIEIYKAERKYCNKDGNMESNELLKKQSINIKTFKCGYCSRHINVPILMYSDNAFCKIACRNNQIQYDKNKNNPHTRTRTRNYTI